MANAQSRTRRKAEIWDDKVNDLWDGESPVLSGEESIAAAKKLYRHAFGKSWRGKWKLTSGNRRTWPEYGTFYVNPDRRRKWGGERGLREIIHSISHYAHWQLHPGDKPHSIRQARLESKLTKFAIARGWHKGALAKTAPEPVTKAKPDKVQLRYQRLRNRRDKYVKEMERLKRLLPKAEREVRAYERRHGERLALVA